MLDAIVVASWWALRKNLALKATSRTNYDRYPTGRHLIDVCDEYMERIKTADMLPGDVVAMTFENDPQHVAFVGDYELGGLSLIHALARSEVVEQRLDSKWAKRITQAYRIPGVE